ncbi:histidine phosphatase family protein [Paenibacillus sp. UNC451MF]|uniref:histidine phosphatase family protein n=1 Tax=Paenibacillus sp. UNC451MF TaxID=1449063 RepID=UPI00048D5A16|nr:histidine phosphatase family protein [Paenibacillus sp. UNC451MF]
MSTDFYLVRHAKKEKGIGDVALSLEGMLEAKMTASHFRKMPIKKIISSPLRRAQQTAQVIAETTMNTIFEDIRLRERANWGDLPEQTFEEFVEMWERCTKERDFSPPIGDSARKAGDRLSTCLLELSVEHPEDSMIIVTHGGLITDFLVNVFSEEELSLRHPNFITEQSNLVAECSITKVSCKNGIYRLVDFANGAHLL